MTEETHRAQVVRYWWSKAEESLHSAERELEAGSLLFAMNRIYYAAFYAASAALLDRKISYKKHSGVRAAFHREFVRNGPLSRDWGKLYDQLFEDRQESDYIALSGFEEKYVQHQMNQCREFLAELRPLVSMSKEG